MADFNQPTETTLYTLVLTRIKEAITTAITWFDGTVDSNIPDKAKRYNTGTNKFQIYSSSGGTWANLGFHTAIDNHIADSALHSGVPTGTVLPFAGSSLPTNYLFCQGQAISRTTYAALYAALGGASSPWGQGDGSTTFNVPDLRTRFPLGRATSGGFSSMAGTGGAIDHTHSTPAHTHTIPSHVHDITHAHALNDHAHTAPSHVHNVPAHYHEATASGGTINVAPSGAHTHNMGGWQNARSTDVQGTGRLHYGGTNFEFARANATVGGTKADVPTDFTLSAPTHSHPASSIGGTVGAPGSGNSGDAGFNSGSGGNSATSGVNGGAGSTQNFAGNTAASGTLTSNSGGSGTSGTANPPYVILDYIIKT